MSNSQGDVLDALVETTLAKMHMRTEIHGQHVSEMVLFFFFQAEDGIRDYKVTGVQTCALPIYKGTTPNNAGPTLCQGLVSFFNSPFTCIGRSIAAFIAEMVVYISVWILTVAGVDRKSVV